MRSIFNICLAAVMLLCTSTIWGQPDIENQKGKNIQEYLTADNHIDLQAIRSSGYKGALNLNGFDIKLDPVTGDPIVRVARGDYSKSSPDDVYWEGGFCSPGCDAYIWAMTVYDNKLIAGGEFTTAGGVTANYIASWDGSDWSPLGSGMDGFVHALTVFDNQLIAGGYFTTADGVPANHIASWDGSNWSPLGSGMDGDVSTLTVYDNKLIAAGNFTTAGGTTANHIASWDGSNWSPLGSGMNDWVRALTVYDNQLIAGGDFTTAGGTTAYFIASWDGSNWSPLGSGMNDWVRALTVYDNQLIAGGDFTTAGGTAANCIASWDGSSWSPLGLGMNSTIHALTVYDNQLIAGGHFTTAGGVIANYIASWDGSSWSPLGLGMNDWVNALTVYDNQLIAGGSFPTAGGVTTNRIASWDGADWSALGQGMDQFAYALSEYDNDLICGGSFTTAGGATVNGIAAWDGSAWSSLGSGMGGTSLAVRALATYDNQLIAGGHFSTAGGVGANRIAAWDGASWSALGSGMNGDIYALAVFEGDLIAGGGFTNAGGTSVGYIASWNGSTWSALGSGLDNYVYDMVVFDNKLIAGGKFTSAGGSGANCIAAWDGASWVALSSGMEGGIPSSYVRALAVYDNELIAGGFFTTAGGASIEDIAAWDGSTWSAIGPGVNDIIQSLEVFDNKLIAAGHLTMAGGMEANHIASWDGSSWEALGSGIDNVVWALGVSGSKLYAGGGFSMAGEKPSSYIAAWTKMTSYREVTSLDDDGVGTLRAAINGANSNAGPDTITFSISGTINLSTALPALTDDSTIILGSTAPGGPHSIIIDGSSLTGSHISGLQLSCSYCEIEGLTINNWDWACIRIFGHHNNVYNCYLNVNSNGDAREAGDGFAIDLDGNYNMIGGPGANDKNIMSMASSSAAIWVNSSAHNSIYNNYIGLTPWGTKLGTHTREGDGIWIQASDSNYVGDTTMLPNFICNTSRAIYFDGGVENGFRNEVANNIIGLAPNMTDTISNNYGIFTSDNICRLNTIGPENLIAGCLGHGIQIGPNSSDYIDSNTIIGNTIVGNHFSGICLYYEISNTFIGGRNPGDGNIIYGNGENGIYIYDNADSNQVIGNHIGGDLLHPGRSNHGNGIMIDFNCDGNLIDSNIIAFNDDAGVLVVYFSELNTIARNLIYLNGGLGIALEEDGVTLNDPGDTDDGCNSLLNYPEIDSLFMNPDSTFRVYGKAADSAIIEFFVAHPEGDTSQPADPSGYGEAYSYIGSDTADGNGDFEYQINNMVPYFSMITATCTDTLGNTSEFAPNFNLVPTPLIIVGYSPINLQVLDPAGDSIGKLSDDTYFNTIGTNATYEDIVHDSITIQYPLEGDYIIIVRSQGDPPPGAIYSVGIRIDGSLQVIIVENADVPASGMADTLGYEVVENYHFNNGDASRDNTVNLIDILYLIAYLYDDPPGPAPYPLTAGDANCDQYINLIDILYLIAHLYNEPPGPEPCQWEDFE